MEFGGITEDYPKLAPGFGAIARLDRRLLTGPDRTARAPGRKLTNSPGDLDPAGPAQLRLQIRVAKAGISAHTHTCRRRHAPAHTHMDVLFRPAGCQVAVTILVRLMLVPHTAITPYTEHSTV